MFNSASITAFNSAFGAYYKPGGQNADRLRKLMMYDDTPFETQFKLVPLEGDVFEYGLTGDTRVLQAFKPYWSKTGEATGTPRKFTLRRVKVNVESIPDLLVNTWLGFLATDGGKDPNINRATWPFVRWYMEKHLIPRAKQDQYMEAYYGVWADPGTNSTAGAEGASIDGLAMQINTDIDATNITAISTGALETDPELFVDQIEGFAEDITDKYRGLPLDINMHDSFVQLFKQGMLEKYNVNYGQVGDDALVRLRLRSNIRLVGHFNWLDGVGGAPSEKLFCTTADNKVKGVRVGNKETSPMRVEQVDYTLKFMGDWHVFYGYYDPRIVWTNDVELDYGI